MDYTNFVKSYYNYVTKQLRLFENYYGDLVSTNESLDIPREYLVLNNEPTYNTFLPIFSIVVNAPGKCFENFLEYYATLQPDLGDVYLGRQGLRALYSLMNSKNITEDEQYEFITTFIDAAIEVAKQLNILR